MRIAPVGWSLKRVGGMPLDIHFQRKSKCYAWRRIGRWMASVLIEVTKRESFWKLGGYFCKQIREYMR